jgi:predicted Zn finger-like uncharacterized protein
MILTCPQCDTSYNVDIDVLPPEGRKVRCKTCGHTWIQTPEFFPADKKPAGQLSSLSKVIYFFSAFFTITVIAAGVMYTLRPNFFDGLLPLDHIRSMGQTEMLAITEARYSFQEREEGKALIVQGRIQNMTDMLVLLKPVTVKLWNADGQVLYEWELEMQSETLAVGTSEEFIGRLMYPPDDTTQVTIEIKP